MIITRKIECYVAESDPNLKKGYVSTLYSWLRDVRKAANMIVAHKFVQCQMSDFANIDDELREKFIGTKKFVFPSDILKKEKGNGAKERGRKGELEDNENENEWFHHIAWIWPNSP